MREKLIELLKECFDKALDFDEEADHLIANGVTIQRWIPVTERLPKEELEYVTEENGWEMYPCLVSCLNMLGSMYVTKLFFNGEDFVDDEYVRYTAQVTHWMPLPEAPKGE